MHDMDEPTTIRQNHSDMRRNVGSNEKGHGTKGFGFFNLDEILFRSSDDLPLDHARLMV
jgi:hypothetical protein